MTARPPDGSRLAAQRRERVRPALLEARARWNALPRDQQTILYRNRLAVQLHAGGEGMNYAEIAQVFGISPETARQAVNGWSAPTPQEREILKHIRAADGGKADGSYSLIVLAQVTAAAEFAERNAL